MKKTDSPIPGIEIRTYINNELVSKEIKVMFNSANVNVTFLSASKDDFDYWVKCYNENFPQKYKIKVEGLGFVFVEKEMILNYVIGTAETKGNFSFELLFEV